MYNWHMRAKNSINSSLQKACRMTNAVWAVDVRKVQETWFIHSASKLPQKGRTTLLSYLNKGDFVFQVADNFNTKHEPFSIKEFPNAYFYIFPAFTLSVIIICANHHIEPFNLQVWELFSEVSKEYYQRAQIQEVDTLQDKILDLQLKEQELIARINAQHEAEARLIQSEKLAAVGEMAAGIAHELNNPLTTVIGFTEIVLGDLPEQIEVRKDLELVLQEARRARSVVRGLLDFSRQSETLRTKTSINEIIEDVLLLINHLIKTSKVRLETHLGVNLPWVSIDRNQIKQVIINLINNALNAMPEGGCITLETDECSRYSRDWLRVTVRDTGIGIPEENLQRIFEPFFTTREAQGGTGLGLSITYGIVTDHGGMIEVESLVNTGSAFVVWLPLEAQ